MEAYSIRNLTFTYPQRSAPTLRDVTLCIEQGQFITLCGASGSGKSTFLRQLKSLLSPHGKQTGQIQFGGRELSDLDQRTQAGKIGFVMQDPESQIVTDKVWHELAFGLESLGYGTEEIRLRVGEMASFFGIQNWFHRSVAELSGGQKQLLNLASIMTMDPSVLILDEPTAQLDPIAAADFLATLQKINRELGVTVLLSEHRLEDVLPMSDRVLVMEEGRIIADGTPEEVGGKLRNEKHGMFLSMPAPMRIYAGVENDLPCPVTIREGRAWLGQMALRRPLLPLEDDKEEKEKTGAVAIEASELWFRYAKDQEDVVKGLSFRINEGETYAVLGGNGTGKTTALNLIGALRKPYRGKISINGKKTAILPQNPQSLFVKKTVREDLMEILEDDSGSGEEKERKLLEMAELCRLTEFLESHPYDISGGEQQRTALAKVLLREPDILLLDEPTKGMDGEFKRVFGDILAELKASGVTILMVSHDVEFCAQYADRCALFFDGRIVSEGKPRAFFSGNRFYTTGAGRMARGLLPQAIMAEDVIRACGGTVEKQQQLKRSWKLDKSRSMKSASEKGEPGKCKAPEHTLTAASVKRKLERRTWAAMAIILLTIPLTIFAGIYYLEDRKYYFISLLILLEAMLPFALVFERRKPEARELVILAVLCGIGVTARAAFFMVPQFKPVVALVIIAAVCFGGEAGFLVGAMTAFLSNFFFGQGPWTPWQMFGLGIIGFLAGVLFQKGLLKKETGPLCIFGAAATFFIYGGLMNPASVLIFQGQPTWQMFLLAYLQGIPMDLIHAAATVIFLWLIARPMLEKLDRIKIKYGLCQRDGCANL